MRVVTKFLIDPWEGRSSLLFAFFFSCIIFLVIAESLAYTALLTPGIVEDTPTNRLLISAPIAFYCSISLWRCSKNNRFRVLRFFAKVFAISLSTMWIYPAIILIQKYQIIQQPVLV